MPDERKKIEIMKTVKILGDTQLIYLTVDQFLELQRGQGKTEIADTLHPERAERKLTFGYSGIAIDILGGASKATVFRLLKSGRISPAVSQHGRKIACDVNMALELLRQQQGGRR